MADDVLTKIVQNKLFREMSACEAPVIHVVPETGAGKLVFVLARDDADCTPSSTQNRYRWPQKVWRGRPTTT